MLLALLGAAQAQLQPPGATPQRLATGYNFTEGPVYDGVGAMYFTNLVFSNQFNSDIIRYDIASKVATVVDPASDGANGLYLDANGQIVSADQATHRISRRSATDIAVVEAVLASGWNGRGFNSPNDLVIDADGGIYFTDPDYNNVRAQPEGVYYLSPAGVITQILSGFSRPNGIILSPGGGTLYLAVEAERRIMAYDVVAGGVLANGRQFKSTSVDAAGNPHSGHGPDGLGIDAAGNLYAAVQNEIWAWSPQGVSLMELPVPQDPTNVAFGDVDGRTLYITAQNSFYGIELNVPSPAQGDYDGDGAVTAADYTVWRDTLGATENLSADGNGNRIIDDGDFDLWSSRFSDAAENGAVTSPSVPEPSVTILLAIGLLKLAHGRRR